MTAPKKPELAWSTRSLVEETLRQEWVFRGKLLRVRRDSVRLPDGHAAEREYIEHPGAVVIVPLLDGGEVVLERQFRYPLRRDMIELPAGKLDDGEPPLQCARRELREETGYAASQWHFVATLHPSVGYADERIELFLARGLTHVGAQLDHGEHLETFHLSLAEALEWVRTGCITDGKTIIGLFWAERILNGGWTADPAV